MTDCRRVLLERLIDDAGQFPPAMKSLDQAVEDHLAVRSGPHSWLLGRFLCPASKLVPGLPRPVGVVADGDDWEIDLDSAMASGADSFELRDPGADAYAVLAAAPIKVFVERPHSIEALSEHFLGAKIRCGGVTAEAFPSDAAVAHFIAECRRFAVPFKATAGLHHPTRTRDVPMDVLMHGFLNLLAATVMRTDDLEAIIAETDIDTFRLDADGFAWRDLEADAEAIEQGRRLFMAFGSCSFSEPVEDLTALGMLESARA